MSAAQGVTRAPLRAPVKVALAPRASAPPALRCRTLRSARLQRSAARDSESSAALQMRLRGRHFKMLRNHTGIGTPWPFGHAGADSQIEALVFRNNGELTSALDLGAQYS